MKLWKRRTILIFSIILFIILAPTIILYSSGYRFDFENFRVKKVGMIIIESRPKDINVFINNKLANKRTPYKKSNLTPRIYNIDLKNDIYQPWSKSLLVESQTVTWITDALLFYKDPLKDVYAQESNIKESCISPDQNFYSYIHITEDNNAVLKLLNLKSRDNNNIFDLRVFTAKTFDKFNPNIITNIIWSNDSRKLILSLKDNKDVKHIIIDIENPDNKILINNNNLSDINWDLNDSNFIYFMNNKNLEKLNINDQNINTIMAKNVSHYDLVSNSVIYTKITEHDDEIISSIYLINKNNSENNLKGNLESINIINEDISEIKAQKDNLYIMLTKNGNLYLRDDNDMLKVSTNIKGFKWNNNKQFIFYNDNSIWHYKIEEDKDIYHPQYQLNESAKLIELESKIDFALWHPKNEHILYSSNNIINIIELDNRDTSNNNVLLKNVISDSVNPIFFNNNGNKIYHLESVKNNIFLTESTLYEY